MACVLWDAITKRFGSRARAGRRNRKKPPNPLLCLSSLTGNSGEFHELARFLTTHSEHPRDVYCLDYRGRGGSENDYTSANYNSYVELRDILDFLVAFDLPHFDIIGSSRGGINAMLLAAVRPAGLGALILNDLGPVLEPGGVARVLGYLANMPQPNSWADATQIMRSMYETSFPALDEDDWKAFATALLQGARWPVLKPAMTHAFGSPAGILICKKHCPICGGNIWPCSTIPLLIIRGENSDMLSRKTVEQMRTLHWHSRAVTVPGQGHAPLLRDQPSLQTIGAFLAEHD